MKIRSIVAAAALATASFGANAALTTYAPWDAALAANGLAGVLFDVNTDAGTGATVALGAHAYKNGVSLPNDGTGTFYAPTGTYAGPPAEADRANWSFDFAWNLGNCGSCTVWLGIDTDRTSGVSLSWGNLSLPVPFGYGSAPVVFESWNVLMSFIMPSFDTNSPSSTAFALEVRNSDGHAIASSNILVNVPEPGTLALAGLGLALAGIAGRRRRTA